MEMIFWVIINYTVNLVETLIIIKFMGSMLDKRLSKQWYCIMIVSISLISYVFSNIFESVMCKLLLYLIILAFIWLMFEGSLTKKIIGWLTLLIINIALDNFSVFIIMVVMKQQVNVFVGNSIYRLVAMLISKLSLYYLTLWLVNRKKQFYDVKIKTSFVAMVIFFFINIVFNMLIVLNIFKHHNIQDKTINFLVFSFAITCLIAVAIYENILIQSKEHLELQLYKQQENLHKKYLLAIESSTQEMKRIKHDFANHMMCVLGYIETKNYNKLEQYIHKLYKPLETTDDIFVVGHPVISSMIYSKMLSAKKYKIFIKVESFFENTVKIDDIDLCILIGNILDNAMEACMNIYEEKRIILLSVQTKKEWFLLDCINPVDVRFLIKNGETFKTNKKDKAMHGIGLKNIHNVINKYDGDVVIDLEEQQFAIRISIKNENPITSID